MQQGGREKGGGPSHMHVDDNAIIVFEMKRGEIAESNVDWSLLRHWSCPK